MFRLLRLPLFVVIAFVLGMLWEQDQANLRCEDRGGESQDGVCVGVSQ